MKSRIRELKISELRESRYSIDEIIALCSAKYENDDKNINTDIIELSLLFANEIKRLKEDIIILKGSIQSGLSPDDTEGAFRALELMRKKNLK